jgi:hypothetical protein
VNKENMVSTRTAVLKYKLSTYIFSFKFLSRILDASNDTYFKLPFSETQLQNADYFGTKVSINAAMSKFQIYLVIDAAG